MKFKLKLRGKIVLITLGLLFLAMSVATAFNVIRLRDDFLEVVVVMALSFLAASGLLLIFISKVITGPIEKLVKGSEEIRKHSGSQFDPDTVEIFSSIPEEEWERMRLSSSGSLEEVVD